MKTVAVIGAGASGLPAIKCCLDEGLEPTCFERTDDIGGLWNYTKEVHPDQACVMKSTVINTSKEMMCYSDFPIPSEYPIYMHNAYVQKYFRLYADKFGLDKYIKFNNEVLRIVKHEDHESTGQWTLQVRDRKSNMVTSHVFDAVMVATGHHAKKKMPDFPGMDTFKGDITHTHDYKSWKGYEDKKAVVVGGGNSGGDVAVELSRVASKAFLSTRRGAWIINRIDNAGTPVDMLRTRRIFELLRLILPDYLVNLEWAIRLNSRFDHAKYALKPKHKPLAQHPTINDDLPNKIANGSVIIKPNIKCFSETEVEFDDGTKEDADAVILGTGYIFGFPFIDKSIIDVKDNQIELYKYMFPPDLDKPTLSVIGCCQPVGAIMPLSEMQARLATRVFKGDVQLPSRVDRWVDIRKKKIAMRHRYVESTRHTIQVDFIPYIDELAKLNGCRPNLAQMLLRDPVLAIKCFSEPCTPYQFRLEGPGKWVGARQAIMTQWDRTWQPMKTRPLDIKQDEPYNVYVKLAVALVILFLVWGIFL
ncbi:dimethylaniline monooxygenase [N-oxide-forming] 5-like isoform X1 [Mizuhopecten yessoensis]|uniref:dimethylaniline monooxygenase [N-oxide-forming] 5-like isoform X1 n=1 Tax=Mizuhopecten yessoensis TaxID=6573 RepID=UPI000B45C34E|nr:dimethylaniline monooxygenase [N-oxide-forming] 5-like isoform X1 [Mizuhopecten yessoensis]XP_021380303.1 dimethylaniline monooxygenase [N-oxide-forming] 5-like isoform X1 [Mizuhopecten yessoensis]